MRRLALLAIVGLLALSVPVGAAERGTIRGRIVNETTGTPQGGVKVQLLGLAEDRSESLTREVTTGPDGTYRFEDLTTGTGWIYVIDARYDGGLFPGSPIKIPSNTTSAPVIDTTLKVWDTTDDPASVLVRLDSMFAIAKDEQVGVVESVTIVNSTDLAYIGRGEKARAGSSSTFGFALPDGADPQSVRVEDASVGDAPLDVPRLVRTSFGFAVTIAIPPGETNITYSYAVRGGAGSFDLSRTTLYPTLELLAFAPDPLEIESSRLTPDGSVFIEDQESGGEGREYNKWQSTDDFDAGDPVQLLVVATGAPPWGVFAAAGAGIALLVGILLGLSRARRRRTHLPKPVPEPASDRDELVAAIAALDLDFETGEMSRDEWTERRNELKTKLQEKSAVG